MLIGAAFGPPLPLEAPMKVRALKRLAGSYGLLDKGNIIDLPNYLANDLLALGYVEIFIDDEAAGPESSVKRRGRKNAAGQS